MKKFSYLYKVKETNQTQSMNQTTKSSIVQFKKNKLW